MTDYSDATDHRIWYRRQGDTGPRVLFVMGFAMRGLAWERQVAGLKADHECVYFDHAGLGHSGPISKRRLKMDDMADDVLGLMDTLGWDDAHLVGISMGGMIAQHVALRAQDRLRSLTLAATTAGGFPHFVPPAQGLKLFLAANGSQAGDRVDALGRLLFSDAFLKANPDLSRTLIGEDFAGTEPPKATRLAHLHAVLNHSTAKRLHELSSLPTLIVKPTHDVLVSPQQCDRLSRLIPNSTLHEVNAAHGLTREIAEEFNSLLRDHIQSVERAGS